MPLKIRKIGSCNKKNHLSAEILYWNRTWFYTPQNTSESRRNRGERLETLEKQGCRTRNALKIIVVGIGQGRQLAREDRRQPTMLEEVWEGRCVVGGAPRIDAWGTWQILVWGVWLTSAPSGHRTWWSRSPAVG